MVISSSFQYKNEFHELMFTCNTGLVAPPLFHCNIVISIFIQKRILNSEEYRFFVVCSNSTGYIHFPQQPTLFGPGIEGVSPISGV